MATPEDRAREQIDQALEQAGWKVQDYKSANLPNSDIIAQEIVDDLEAALEQFRLIANDLGQPKEQS
jgi:type I site-specific restriction endonuclease